jgi:DNA repair protein RadA
LSSPDVDSSPKQHKVSYSNNVLKSADEFSHQQGKQRLSTGSKNLDDLLSGGLETGAITQFYGASNTGKTHLCHLLCVVLPSPYQAIYIDTEGGFREERIQSIATARRLDWTNILSNIQVLQPKDSKQQESHIKDACSIVKSFNSRVKLLIVDSMMFHYIAKYPGRSDLSKRAHSLNIYMHMLHNLTQTNKNIAVLITNQSTSNPRHGEFEANSPQPFGGKVISNTSTYIVNLECGGGYFASNIDARLIKSPLSSFNSRPLKIVESGFVDVVPNYLSENGEDVAGGLDE